MYYEFLMKIPILNILYFLLILLCSASAFKRVMEHLEKKENVKLVEKFVDIHSILSFHMDASYETIHKDNILVYSLDGVKPNEKDIDHLCHEFVKLTLKLAGPNMIKIFTELYGEDDNLFFVMMDYFNRRFEDDEIRASAVDTIQEGEEL